ncbi:MAG: beta-lactamase family protein [Gammaproteobacteria bacterium]|nr:beta-lactamase family protein [Gammaproteobacteria bacterium]
MMIHPLYTRFRFIVIAAAVTTGLATLLAAAPTPGFAATPAQRAEKAGISPTRLERLSATLESYIRDERLPGSVTLVMRRGEVVYHEAHGWRDREQAAAMPRDAIFRIASQSKALVSVGILLLQEEGQLLLSDPLEKYLPSFANPRVAVPREGSRYDLVPAKRGITLHDLLTHTAGIAYGTGTSSDLWQAAGIQGWYFADRNEPVAAVVERMGALPLESQPGERWVYGYATDILGVVIEKVSGKTLDAFLREKIFEPLAMRDTHFYLPSAKQNRLAVVYGANSSGKGLYRLPNGNGINSQGAYTRKDGVAYSGGAGLLSTASDYGRFLRMLAAGGSLDGKRLLSRKSVELMINNGLGDVAYRNGEGFGLGFSMTTDVGRRAVPSSLGEFGWGGAYHSVYWVDPHEDLIVVYLTQLMPAGKIDDHAKLRALVYQAIID